MSGVLNFSEPQDIVPSGVVFQGTMGDLRNLARECAPKTGQILSRIENRRISTF
jgi:hypothetical protein